MRILNTRRRGKVVFVTKGLAVGLNLFLAMLEKNRCSRAQFDKEERDEVIRKLMRAIANSDANAK